MSLPRDIAQLELRLREQPILDPFAAESQAALLDSPEASAIIARLETAEFSHAPEVLRLCLQTLRIQEAEVRPQRVNAELVATLPPELPAIARTTGQVLREMLRTPKSEIIVLGYEVTDRDIMGLLEQAVGRGVEVIMICDRGRGSARKILESWPDSLPPPRVFEDRDRPEGAPYASMHAKCLLVDGLDLLITSANFTFHGLHGNIEIGVRLTGELVTEARSLFSHLVQGRVVSEVTEQ